MEDEIILNGIKYIKKSLANKLLIKKNKKIKVQCLFCNTKPQFVYSKKELEQWLHTHNIEVKIKNITYGNREQNRVGFNVDKIVKMVFK